MFCAFFEVVYYCLQVSISHSRQCVVNQLFIVFFLRINSTPLKDGFPISDKQKSIYIRGNISTEEPKHSTVHWTGTVPSTIRVHIKGVTLQRDHNNAETQGRCSNFHSRDTAKAAGLPPSGQSANRNKETHSDEGNSYAELKYKASFFSYLSSVVWMMRQNQFSAFRGLVRR